VASRRHQGLVTLPQPRDGVADGAVGLLGQFTKSPALVHPLDDLMVALQETVHVVVSGLEVLAHGPSWETRGAFVMLLGSPVGMDGLLDVARSFLEETDASWRVGFLRNLNRFLRRGGCSEEREHKGGAAESHRSLRWRTAADVE